MVMNDVLSIIVRLFVCLVVVVFLPASLSSLYSLQQFYFLIFSFRSHFKFLLLQIHTRLGPGKDTDIVRGGKEGRIMV